MKVSSDRAGTIALAELESAPGPRDARKQRELTRCAFRCLRRSREVSSTDGNQREQLVQHSFG